MDQGVAIVLAATIPALIVAVEHRITRKSIRQVDKKVDTLNESTLGEIASEDATRRIEKIPHDDRTEKEQRHLDAAPETEPPQGPPR